MKKKLYRSKDNKIIAGIVGWIAEYFDIDPTILRLAWVALTFFGMGAPVVVYIIGLIIIPQRPGVDAPTE